ncbi:MAG TPA: extracellular solute-binding protein [Chloroflexota bacterium]|nr:extracellular solute-binding protein [Chloroflexota bacterium]
MALDRRLERRALLRLAAAGGGAALLAACQAPAPAAAPPAAAPTPGPASAAGAPADWERQWADLIDGARREGTVVFSGPPTPEVRAQVTARFKERFGVDVEYLGGRRGDLVNRLRAERAAGLYTVDVVVGGATTIVAEFYPEGLIDPVRPVLIHPDVIDPTKWTPGKLWFLDPDDQYALRLVNNVSPALAVNTTRVQPSEITSVYDLLKPQYRGLIAQDDPTVSGSGSNTAAALQIKLGEDFIHRLYADQQVGFTRDRRQLADWLGRGTYPIVLNPTPPDVLRPLQRDGFPIVVIPQLPDLPASITAGSGIAILLNQAPHPNAARLLLNWLASREGLEVYARAEHSVPLRNDIEPTWVEPYEIPQPGVEYFDTFGWEFSKTDRLPVIEKIKAWRGS